MATEEVLRKTLRNADGKPFVKYKGIENNFSLEGFEIMFDSIQTDKTGHTNIRVRVPMKAAAFPEDTRDTPVRCMALRDLVARRFWESARTHARSPIPKSDGGEIFIPRPGQEILDRGSIAVTQYYVEARFTADLPSRAGKVCQETTEELIFGRIATIVSESLHYSAYKPSKVYNHIHTAENAEFIRDSLESKGLVGFIAEGSVLPRRDDDLAPMVDAVPFGCDDSLKVTFEVPNGEPIVGMGVRKGFTVLTGPSRNGKSAIADALYAGVYDHIPGDGREYVISSSAASFVIDEGGRPADSVDISMFVSETPEFKDTSKALSAVVSAPMSELVSVSESVELGSDLLIVDEEYSSPSVIRRGFLAVDDSIVSLSEMGRAMAEAGVSMVMVTGDESAVRSADSVVLVKGFHASAVGFEPIEHDLQYRRPVQRYPMSNGINYEKGRKDVSTYAVSVRSVEIGEYKVDAPMAAIYDIAQARSVADAIVIAKDLMDGSRTMLEVCTEALKILKDDDDADNGSGMHHAYVRPMDMAAFLNRHPQMLAIQKN